MNDDDFMRAAIALSHRVMAEGKGGPFGAVIVRDGEIIAEGYNQVTSGNDPTAHAEVSAIREACRKLGTFALTDCDIYTSCEPCPMCLSAIYWARLRRMVYANARQDAARIGFDDEFLYQEVAKAIDDRTLPTTRLLADEAIEAFKAWDANPDKITY
jgi:tRNA(Arg) A34 adenosine deaminase TadA